VPSIQYIVLYQRQSDGNNINLFIELGPELDPVLEVAVDNVDEAKRRLVQPSCTIVKTSQPSQGAT
jgi:hypothetical protein